MADIKLSQEFVTRVTQADTEDISTIGQDNWRERYIARLVWHGLDIEFATADFEAAADSHDYESNPEDAADDEYSYMGEG